MSNFKVLKRSENSGRTTCYRIKQDDHELSFEAVIELLEHSNPFRDLFIDLFRDVSYEAYRWETPPVCIHSLHQVFECVLIDSPDLKNRQPDEISFDEYLTKSKDRVVGFYNLGRDAFLLVPKRELNPQNYTDLASFMRHAPYTQVQALWKKLAVTMKEKLDEEKIWLNTAGGGVAWLHVRLDRSPKYYHHMPYKRQS